MTSGHVLSSAPSVRNSEHGRHDRAGHVCHCLSSAPRQGGEDSHCEDRQAAPPSCTDNNATHSSHFFFPAPRTSKKRALAAPRTSAQVLAFGEDRWKSQRGKGSRPPVPESGCGFCFGAHCYCYRWGEGSMCRFYTRTFRALSQ